MVDSQVCVSFCYIAKCITCTTHISTLFQIFSHVGHYRVLSRFPCAIQQVLIRVYIYLIHMHIYIYIYIYIHIHTYLFMLCCCSVAKSSPALRDPRTAACQAPLSLTISRSLLNLMPIELVMFSMLMVTFVCQSQPPNLPFHPTPFLPR